MPAAAQQLPAWTLLAVEAVRLYQTLQPKPAIVASCAEAIAEVAGRWSPDIICPLPPSCPECAVCPVGERGLEETWLPRLSFSAALVQGLFVIVGRCCPRRNVAPARRGGGVVRFA